MPFDGGRPQYLRPRYDEDAFVDDFIGGLCFALAHRWEPERRFVIFTAYLDESNTGSKEPDITVAGYLGTARQWRLIERRLRQMKREYGFQKFHATRFKAKQDDFRGWSDTKCSRLVGELATIVRDGLEEAVTICLPHKQY
ncbi:MAG: hypothetical protein ACHQK9_23470, partial [Reyranellales bacterium]